MKKPDYISLNVPALLRRYENQSDTWQPKILALTRTLLASLKKYELIESNAPALRVPVEEVVIKFSDYTHLGQEFVLTGAIDKWMASCDRKGSLEVYEDETSLEKRIKSFFKNKSG